MDRTRGGLAHTRRGRGQADGGVPRGLISISRRGPAPSPFPSAFSLTCAPRRPPAAAGRCPQRAASAGDPRRPTWPGSRPAEPWLRYQGLRLAPPLAAPLLRRAPPIGGGRTPRSHPIGRSRGIRRRGGRFVLLRADWPEAGQRRRVFCRGWLAAGSIICWLSAPPFPPPLLAISCLAAAAAELREALCTCSDDRLYSNFFTILYCDG